MLGGLFSWPRPQTTPHLTIEAKLTLVYCDDFYGPHLILTVGGSKVEVAPTLAEIKALHQWCEVLIRAHAVKI
jgi:hypothetical protein